MARWSDSAGALHRAIRVFTGGIEGKEICEMFELNELAYKRGGKRRGKRHGKK